MDNENAYTIYMYIRAYAYMYTHTQTHIKWNLPNFQGKLMKLVGN